MSYDQFVAAMRDDLVDGARRRRRHERRRTRVLAATPLVALLVLGTVVWANGDRRDDVVTNAGPTPAVIDACNALHDQNSAREILDKEATSDAFAPFAALAVASGDDQLADLGPALATVPEGVDEDGFREWYEDVGRAEDRCRELGAPGWVPVFAPAEFGPEPTVALDDYGTVIEWLPVRNEDDLPEPSPMRISGRDLEPVRAARTATGSFVASWQWAGTVMRACHYVHAGNYAGSSCGGPPDVTAPPPNGLAVSGGLGYVIASTGERVSFVVVEAGGQRYVQRPAERTAAVDLVAPLDDLAIVTVRSYDADGTELGCRTKMAVSPNGQPC